MIKILLCCGLVNRSPAVSSIKCIVLLAATVLGFPACHFSIGEPTQKEYVDCLQQTEKLQSSCVVLRDNELYEARGLEKEKDAVVSLVINDASMQTPLFHCDIDFALPKQSQPVHVDWMPLLSQPAYSPQHNARTRRVTESPNPLESWFLFPSQENSFIFSYRCHCDAGLSIAGIYLNSAHRIIRLDRQAKTCRVQLLHHQSEA